MKIQAILFAALIIFVHPAAAQSPPGKVFTVIESAAIQVQQVQPLRLVLKISGYHPDGCDLPVQVVQQRSAYNIRISIYREAPGDVMCPQTTVPYEESVTLDGDFAPGMYTVQVNDYSLGFSFMTALPQDHYIAESVMGEALTVIQAVGLLITPDQKILLVVGFQPDNCDAPVEVTQSPGNVTLFVTIFRRIPSGARCEAAQVPYQEAIPLELGDMAGLTAIDVNGYRINLGAPPPPQPVSPRLVYHIIERVDAFILLDTPYRIGLEVHGFQPDSCSFPVQVTQTRRGSFIHVEIFRRFPDMAMADCPPRQQPYDAMIPLEGWFDSGVTYFIDVNGYQITVEIPGWKSTPGPLPPPVPNYGGE